MTHSKAPWIGGGEVVMDADGRAVCTINRNRKGSTGFVPIMQWKGDSRLISAAPQLLQFCERLFDGFPELKDEDEPLNGADAVDRLCAYWPELVAALTKAGVI